MDRDIVVLVGTEASHRPRLIVEKGADSTAVLLTLVPRLEDLVTVSSEVVFLIDCSLSMGDQSILNLDGQAGTQPPPQLPLN